jgi:hypothetical protein
VFRKTYCSAKTNGKSGVDCVRNVAKISAVHALGIFRQDQIVFFDASYTISRRQVVAEQYVLRKTKSGVL